MHKNIASESLKKYEKIKSNKKIQQVLSVGVNATFFPISVNWLKTNESRYFSPKIAISVSKKLIKLAVDRNLLRRRIFESYRKNNSQFLEISKKKLSIASIFPLPIQTIN